MPPAAGRSVSIHRSLLGNITLVIVVLGAAIVGLMLAGSRETVHRLTGVIVDQTIAQIELRLQRLFEPVVHDLRVLRSWGKTGMLDVDDPALMNRLLEPLLRVDAHRSAAMLADARGREHILLRLDDTWRSRQTRRDVWGVRTAWREWRDGQPAPAAFWKDLDYDPRQRPWYAGAASTLDAGGAGSVHWTPPYTFFTAQAPGITASVAFRGRSGRVHVAGFDVLLSDVSAFTTRLRAGRNGVVMVLAEDGRVIGLPRDARFESPAARQAALLAAPDTLGVPVVRDALGELRGRPPTEAGPRRFASGGEPWWADMRAFVMPDGPRLSIAVMVPEADLSGGLGPVRLGIILLVIGGLVAAIARGAGLARRYSRPIEALARESDRIARGDVEPGPAVTSSISEVRRLAEAHERMRLGLRTLLKLERDLQLARTIQQDTLPERLPALPGFEIEAWNEAADATGGDTYDAIGYEHPPGALAPRLTDTGDRAVLLLADATGHGIGPALSVTQVRAMLRMAVRAGADVATIVRHMNAQLCGDLSDGRFIGAWLGDLDARAGTLTSFSCGQGPLLHYRARERACRVVEPDAPPLGVVEDLEVAPREPLRLEPGDVFLALSDGVVEAANPQGERFGTARVADLVAQHRDVPASALLAALRDAIAAFTGPRPARDDRTALVVRRSSSSDPD